MTTPLLKTGRECGRIFTETARVYWTLLKVMVPALIVVKLLDMLGATEALAHLLSPVMQLLGLPDVMGLVWAATLLTNIYTGMMVFFNLSLEQPLSVAQVSVLGILMLLAHSLPIEGAVARSAGVSWRATLSIRIGGALLLGALTNLIYSHFDLLQDPSALLWRPEGNLETGLGEWALNQAETLLWIFPVILTLLALLRLLQLLGVERLIHYLLFPVLRILGIGKAAANVTVIGTVLGLTFGAGLLIREARSGRISQRDIFLTLSFLGLCHSLIEDTLIIMLLGADLSAILWARLAFAILAIGILARLAFIQRKSGAISEADQA